MARIDELLEIDEAPLPRAEDLRDIAGAAEKAAKSMTSLSDACDEFAKGLIDFDALFADLDFDADSFKVEWTPIGLVGSGLNFTINDTDVSRWASSVTMQFDTAGLFSISNA